MKCPICGKEEFELYSDSNNKPIVLNFMSMQRDDGQPTIRNDKLKLEAYICKECDYVLLKKHND